MTMEKGKQNSFSFKLTDIQQALLIDILQSGNYKRLQVPYTQVAVEALDCKVNLYTSGKLLVQGKGAQDFVMFVLEPNVLGEARLGYEDVLNPEAFQPHMGVDESGKGDFFGPMVIASAYVDEAIVKRMEKMGVKDSKRITSDKKALDMAEEIRKLLGKCFSLVVIGPAAYNRLYFQMKNVNRILSWGHARAIENLLADVPSCPRAISDQFGNKEQVKRALMKKGKEIDLVQMHRAESDMAVAAASVLARGAFVKAIQDMGKEYDIEIRKGASNEVVKAARELVEKNDPDVLIKTAKCHFRTTDVVLEGIGKSRSDLGEHGQVKSRPRSDMYARKSSGAGKGSKSDQRSRKKN